VVVNHRSLVDVYICNLTYSIYIRDFDYVVIYLLSGMGLLSSGIGHPESVSLIGNFSLVPLANPFRGVARSSLAMKLGNLSRNSACLKSY